MFVKGGPVDVVFKPEVGVIVGGLVVDTLDEGEMMPEEPTKLIDADLVDRL